jgi:hypothetical protein
MEIIIQLIMEELADDDLGLSIDDVKFDLTTRLIVFKFKKNSSHRFLWNAQEKMKRFQKQLTDMLAENGKASVMVAFMEEDTNVEFLTDEDLAKIGLQRIPERTDDGLDSNKQRPT